jgi:hypothetical protein
MRLKTLALGAAAALGLAGLAAAAAAATQNSSQNRPENSPENRHVLTVQSPDGAVVHILYFGDTPPQVQLQAAQPFASAGWPGGGASLFDPGLPAVDQVMAQMDRQADLMLAQAERMMRAAPSGQGLQRAGLGKATPGVTGYAYVSTVSTRGACTRTVEYRSTGNGRPQVTSRTSGDCGAANAQSNVASSAPSNVASRAAAGGQPLRLMSVAYRPAP